MQEDNQATTGSAQEFIGTCFMEDDGTIVLKIRAHQGGMIGSATMTYPMNHPQYTEILAHVGPLLPGETRGVAPWPD